MRFGTTLFFAAALCAAACSLPSRVVVVQDDEQDSFKEALSGVKDLIPDVRSVLVKDGIAGIGAGDVVVALGDQSAQADYPASTRVVAALLADPEQKIARAGSRVSSLPDAFCLMSKIHDLVPNLGTLAVFNTQDHFKSYIKYLGAAGFVTTTKVVSYPVNSPTDLITALRALPGQAQALWLTPETALLDLERFRLISSYCLANKIALIAPVTVLANSGALAGVSPRFRDLGRAAAQTATDLANGKTAGPTVSTEKCEAFINVDTAKALGFKVDSRDGTLVQ